MDELTPKQRKLYEYYTDPANARPPTIKACREYLGHNSDNSIVSALKAIKKKGYPLKVIS